MSGIFQSKSLPFVSDIALTSNQDKYLVRQVIAQLDQFYNHADMRRLALNAFTGSGKTTVAIKALIPEFIRNFYPQKRVIGFMAPRKEVVRAAYRKACNALDSTTVDGAKIRVYDQEDLDLLQERIALRKDKAISLDGDVIVVFMTAQYFNSNYNFLSSNGILDLMIVDEAHIMFGTINEEDTKADKGNRIKDFRAVTLDKLGALTSTAVLFLTATPTNSQQTFTDFGKMYNIYLTPMPRDILTTPFYDVVPYMDYEDVLFKGLEYFHQHCNTIGELLKDIENDTWAKAKDNFYPTYPVLLARLSQRNATNGLGLEQYIDAIRDLCKKYKFKLFISTSEWKEFDGDRIPDMDTGVERSSIEHNTPIVMLVLDSGYAGVDLVKINNVLIARNPSSIIHNNYSQTAGRAARMKFSFVNHATAAEKIREYSISDEQKRLLAEYYIEHSSSIVHVPVVSKLLNGDVKDFIETDTFRKSEGAEFILSNTFLNTTIPVLSLSSSLKDDSYKKYRKTFCEACEKLDDGSTKCFHAAWKGFQDSLQVKISQDEMKLLWNMCLQVHHVDGNHFNNNLDNLLTICPNVHALITMKNQDFNNRYPELRAALQKLIDKKDAKNKAKSS